MKIEKLIPDNDTFSEDDHFSTNASTPLRKDAFKNLSDDEKIVLIQEHFKYILDTLGMDLNDDSISGTPLRVAKMYVKELLEDYILIRNQKHLYSKTHINMEKCLWKKT